MKERFKNPKSVLTISLCVIIAIGASVFIKIRFFPKTVQYTEVFGTIENVDGGSCLAELICVSIYPPTYLSDSYSYYLNFIDRNDSLKYKEVDAIRQEPSPGEYAKYFAELKDDDFRSYKLKGKNDLNNGYRVVEYTNSDASTYKYQVFSLDNSDKLLFELGSYCGELKLKKVEKVYDDNKLYCYKAGGYMVYGNRETEEYGQIYCKRFTNNELESLIENIKKGKVV